MRKGGAEREERDWGNGSEGVAGGHRNLCGDLFQVDVKTLYKVRAYMLCEFMDPARQSSLLLKGIGLDSKTDNCSRLPLERY